VGTLWQDTRYGLRMLARSPGFTLTVVLILAIGIGANTVFSSVVNGVLLRPLPYEKPDELVMLFQQDPNAGWISVSPAAFVQWRQRSTAFERMAAFQNYSFTLTGLGQAEIVKGACVSHGFFRMLGVQPLLGRDILPEDEQPGNNSLVLLSHGFWQRRFGSAPDVVGKIIKANGAEHTVIGVLPRGFSYPSLKGVDLWAPLALTVADKNNYGGHWLQVVARLKEGVATTQADAQMDGIAAQIAQEFPEGNKGLTAVFTAPLHQLLVSGEDELLLILFAGVGSVLLIACANVAGLLLARLPLRQKELAVRVTLGAGASRVARQLLVESLLLALPGGALGLLGTFWGVQLVRAWIPRGFPLVENVGIDGRVLGFVVVVSIVVGLLFGLAPALQVRRCPLIETLKQESARAAGGAHAWRLPAALVVFETAAAVVLLMGGGVMVRSLVNLMRTAPGFQPDHLLTVSVDLPWFASSGRQSAAFFGQLQERAATLPMVRHAALVSYLPTQMGSRWSAVSEEAAVQDGEGPQAAYRSATAGYFQAMGMPLLKGRDFDEQDTPGRPDVVIVNERLARRCWPNDDPIGKRLKPGGPKSGQPWLTVVGVVGNTNNPLNGGWELEMYRPLDQYPARGMSLVVRTEGEPLTVVRNLRAEVFSLSPDAAISEVVTMRQILSSNLSGYRLITVLPGIFAAAALLLAATGLYGTLSYSVNQRTREIGTRMALGAGMSDVLQMILRDGVKLVVIGSALGLIAALAVMRVVRSYLYQVSPCDPLTFLAVVLLLTVVATVACYIPARRAAKVDPMVALRRE